MSVRSLVLAVLACAACDDTLPPRAQWTVFVGTDAPVPQLGDRLILEVVDERGEVCATCRRSFGVGAVSSWPVSFGILDEGSAKKGVRARLVRSSQLDAEGLPTGDRHLDAFAWLPETSEETRVAISLGMDCFGKLSDPIGAATCDPATGAFAAAPTLAVADGAAEQTAVPGSWPSSGPFACGSAAPDDMVCVAGRVFLLGSPRFVFAEPSIRPSPEQLVVLDPFFLDVDEMTVAKVTELVAAGLVAPPPVDTPVSGCTYGLDPLLPINCVDRDYAAALCAAEGKRLPTEAEWEFAASNGALETRYPWLDEAAEPCGQAVVDQRRGRCRPTGEILGPLAGGSPNDVTLLGVRNLAGNVSEWVADDFSAYADPTCWGMEPTLHVNPTCAAAGQPVVRGASWLDDPDRLDVSVRGAPEVRGVGIGVRCAAASH